MIKNKYTQIKLKQFISNKFDVSIKMVHLLYHFEPFKFFFKWITGQISIDFVNTITQILHNILDQNILLSKFCDSF